VNLYRSFTKMVLTCKYQYCPQSITYLPTGGFNQVGAHLREQWKSNLRRWQEFLMLSNSARRMVRLPCRDGTDQATSLTVSSVQGIIIIIINRRPPLTSLGCLYDVTQREPSFQPPPPPLPLPLHNIQYTRIQELNLGRANTRMG